MSEDAAPVLRCFRDDAKVCDGTCPEMQATGYCLAMYSRRS